MHSSVTSLLFSANAVHSSPILKLKFKFFHSVLANDEVETKKNEIFIPIYYI